MIDLPWCSVCAKTDKLARSD